MPQNELGRLGDLRQEEMWREALKRVYGAPLSAQRRYVCMQWSISTTERNEIIGSCFFNAFGIWMAEQMLTFAAGVVYV